jgi:hypothetical protein
MLVNNVSIVQFNYVFFYYNVISSDLHDIVYRNLYTILML